MEQKGATLQATIRINPRGYGTDFSRFKASTGCLIWLKPQHAQPPPSQYPPRQYPADPYAPTPPAAQFTGHNVGRSLIIGGSKNPGNSGNSSQASDPYNPSPSQPPAPVMSPFWHQVIECTVESVSREHLNVLVKFTLDEKAGLEQAFAGRQGWNVFVGPGTTQYTRCKAALDLLTGPDFKTAMTNPLRHMLCRLLPHSAQPPKAFWDTSTPEPPDPNYDRSRFVWEYVIHLYLYIYIYIYLFL